MSDMFTIKNTEQMRNAYIMLDYYQQRLPRARDAELCAECIKEMKLAIRKYAGRPVSEVRVIEDDGINGHTVVFPLPASIQTEDEANEHFMRQEYIEPTYSAYDCTGRPFTAWYKIFRRLGSFWAYHCVRYDV